MVSLIFYSHYFRVYLDSVYEEEKETNYGNINNYHSPELNSYSGYGTYPEPETYSGYGTNPEQGTYLQNYYPHSSPEGYGLDPGVGAYPTFGTFTVGLNNRRRHHQTFGARRHSFVRPFRRTVGPYAMRIRYPVIRPVIPGVRRGVVPFSRFQRFGR